MIKGECNYDVPPVTVSTKGGYDILITPQAYLYSEPGKCAMLMGYTLPSEKTSIILGAPILTNYTLILDAEN